MTARQGQMRFRQACRPVCPYTPGVDRPSMQEQIDQVAADAFGITALFPVQRYVITAILDSLTAPEPGQLRIVVMPTGAGKSVCFQLPARLMPGCSLVIYPLLGLMNDQERRMRAAGLRCAQLRGGQSARERTIILAALAADELDIIITNPETLGSSTVQRALAAHPPVHAVIDEAHCISEWGDTFRAAYLELGAVIRSIGVPSVSAFTATAGDRVLRRIGEVLGDGATAPAVYRGNPDRPGISYAVQPVLSVVHAVREILRPAEEQPLPQPVSSLGKLPVWEPGLPTRLPAIVFCNRRGLTEDLAHHLRRALGTPHGISVYAYHAGMPAEERERIEDAFFRESQAILLATCAYGMGVDKADVRTVIHTYVPARAEAFLQESGRAGRDGQPASSVVLVDPSQQKHLAEDPAQTPVEEMIIAAGCRRATILAHFGVEDIACAGCDRCREAEDRAPRSRNPGECAPPRSRALDTVLAAIRAGGPDLTPGEWAQVLSAQAAYSGITAGLRRHPAWGLLRGWSRWELEDALSELMRCGILKRRRRSLSLPKAEGRGRRDRRQAYRHGGTEMHS